MKKIIIGIMAVALVIFSATSSFASSDGFTWHTVKRGHGYVTKFYDHGKCKCRVYTSKKLKVKVVDSGKLTERRIIKRQNKYILVERIKGSCLNDKGDGRTADGYYISYSRVKGHKAGRKYTTYAVYDNTKYSDDVIERFDYRG